jgi:hypothetical protein
MRRALTVLLTTAGALSLAASVAPTGPVAAQDEVKSETKKASSDMKLETPRPSIPGAERALESYRERSAREAETNSREVDRLRKELHELVDLRCDLLSGLVEARTALAEQIAKDAASPPNGRVASFGVANNTFPPPGPYLSRGFVSGDTTEDRRKDIERQEYRQLKEEFGRELTQVRQQVDITANRLQSVREALRRPTINPPVELKATVTPNSHEALERRIRDLEQKLRELQPSPPKPDTPGEAVPKKAA